ncbi:MAG: RHS repeat domain-containing protein, partial [Solirubrobacterales bacterium]
MVTNTPFVIQALDGRRKRPDGADAPVAERRSGVKQISAQIYGAHTNGTINTGDLKHNFDPNSVPKQNDHEACDQNQYPNAEDSCKLSYSGTFDAGSLDPGIYFFRVVAQDYVGNTTVKDFKVGVGPASLDTVVEGQASSRYVPIQVKRERGSATSASLQYRWAVNGLWCAVPPSATRLESSPLVNAPSSLTLDSNNKTPVVVVDMDALRQLDQTGGGACVHQDSKPRLADGMVYIRGLMAGSGPEPPRASEDVAVRFERGGLGTQNDSAEIGPGTVDLVSGNYSMSSTDVKVSAYKSDLAVTRTYNSRYWQGSNGVFGPGWTIGLPSASMGADYIGVYDNADVGIPEDERYATVEVDTADGEFITFELSEIEGKYIPEAGFETLKLQRIEDAFDATRTAGFKLVDTSTGAVASFMTRHVESEPGEYDLTDVYETGPSDATTYAFGHDAVIGTYPTHAFSPAAGLTCRDENHSAAQAYSALPQGCQALSFGYTQVAGQLRLATIKLKTFDPAIGQDGEMREDVVAQYAYDANGRLTEAWDPRQSTLLPTPTHLKTTYTHLTAADHRIGTVTPPGQQPFTITYSKLPEDSTYGRLSTVTRTSLTAGMATWSVRFFVPTTGTGAPFDFSATETSKWGQERPPFMSAAVFPPDQPPNGTPATNYDRASMSYLDPMGREVNAREPGNRISVTEYDKWGSVVRTLTPENRARAMALPTAAERLNASRKWDTQNTYDDVDGSPSGARHLKETLGPERPVRLDDGTAAEARTRTRYWYDGEDDPGDALDPVDPIDPDTETGEPFDLVTMQKVSALVGTTDHDVRTTTTDYGSTEAQWKLRVPLETVTDPGSGNLQIKRKVDVNADGMETARYQPRSQNLAEPSTTRTVYYTAEANPTYGDCGGKPEWRGLPCQVFQGDQPTTSGLPQLPTQEFTYNHLRQPLTSVERVYDSSSALQTRTSTKTYDEAGRVITESVSGSVGEPVKTTKHIYSPTTGQEVETQSLNTNGTVHKTISRTFDAIGRQTNYTDSEGHSSYVVYDQLSRVLQTGDSKATRIHSYDAITGDLTSISDSGTGVFNASYDQDGRVVSTSMPGGMIKTLAYTASGFQDYVSYSNSNGLVFENWATESVHGQIRELWQKIKPQGQSMKESAYEYRYDKAGRLNEVGDWRNDSGTWKCKVREYTLDEDSNRLEKESIAEQNYYCDFGASGTTTTSTYDDADRITDSGYQYDAFGRITTTPQSAAGGTGDFNATYYVNDLAKSVSQNGTTQTLDLDPNLRMSTKAKVTGGNTTNESYAYVDDSDSPAWIQTGASTWQRFIGGIDGAAGVQDNTGSAKYHFVNLRGDVVATGFPDPVESAEIDEFGVPKTDLPADRRYGFHGSKQREALTSQGM